ncbi:MAG: 3-phosphoshikimate 1-carboxyvinyltransferase [Desulfovibrio sp.]|jgi:5-enolpyruvylshikimate-3-phosphate synthase|nr:3-phosphoshikimate 1-carboxyvinyltransferase [Desulfovibrio sp.]
MPHDRKPPHPPHPPLREAVADIDKELLKLLARRHNLLRRMEGRKGHLAAEDEKFLRRSWEAAAARVSGDGRCSGTLFTLLQEMTFLPPPEKDGGRLPAFNLAPPRKPADLTVEAPLVCRGTRAWLLLAAAHGAATTLAPCLMNDPIMDCVKALNHAGAQIAWEDPVITTKAAPPMEAPDTVLHMGASPWTFFLLLGHYLGRHAKAKFTGDGDLKFANLAPVGQFIQQMGARMVSLVPRSSGLPLRLECSGVLPDVAVLPDDVPPELGEGILLAAPAYAAPIVVDFSRHPRRELSLARTLPPLLEAGAQLDVQGFSIGVTPGPLAVPAHPSLPMEPELAIFLLALPLPLGGRVTLKGAWPGWSEAHAPLALLRNLGLRIDIGKGQVSASSEKPMVQAAIQSLPSGLPEDWHPLAAALAACAALKGGDAHLPLPEAPAMAAQTNAFLERLGLALESDGTLRKTGDAETVPWNAPSPVWALALALVACVLPNRRLGNPGCVTDLFPGFWNVYNTLPAGIPKAPAPAPQEDAPTGPQGDAPTAPPKTQPKARRRILTETRATLPPPVVDDD